MRVIAGSLGGRKLDVPKTARVRPTYDRVRESVFAIIEPYIEGASVLDVFAGSGSLAIEAVSRGARRATLMEIDPAIARAAAGNVRRLGIEGVCDLRVGDALRLLNAGLPGFPFDIAFVDPPYDSGLVPSTLRALARPGTMSEQALVVVERSSDAADVEPARGFVVHRSERYGSTAVDLYLRGAAAGEREQARDSS